MEMREDLMIDTKEKKEPHEIANAFFEMASLRHFTKGLQHRIEVVVDKAKEEKDDEEV